MPVRPIRLSPTSAALGLLLGASLVATSLPARAEEDLPVDRKIMRGIMEGLGLQRDGEAINYQERAPLVIPPSRNLPVPETSGATIAGNPAWPKDPDVLRRKKEAEQERNRNISDEREREQNPLRPQELTPGPGTVRVSRGAANSATPGDRLSPEEMNQKKSFWSGMFGGDKDEVINFTHEPPRAALTAPPVGYQTPSPDQPYGLSSASKAGKQQPTNYLETHGTIEGSR